MGELAMVYERDRVSSIDSVQSHAYDFPYHYIPGLVQFPFFARHWQFAASYLAAQEILYSWFDALPKLSRHRHIDIGCGDGSLVNALAVKYRQADIDFMGVDFDENAIRWARLFSGAPCDFTAGSIGNLEGGEYDTATLVEVFEHIPPSESAGFVNAVSNLLKPGALVMVTVPSVNKKLSDKHYRHFDFATLQREFSGYFDVLDIFAFERRGILMKAATRLMRNRFCYVEMRALSNWEIKCLSKKYRQLGTCGRVGMILKNR